MKPNPHPGRLVVFEGLDGSGQTTQAKLLAKWFSDRGQDAYYTKEPSDGPVGAVLKLLLTHRLVFTNGKTEPGKHDEVTMALYFAGDRADHLRNDIIPKLTASIHVVADRYYLSSLAYQSVAADYDWIRELNRNSLRPDITLFLDVPPERCVERMERQRWHVELYESLDRLRTVRDKYLDGIRKLTDEGERIEILDGSRRIQDVHSEVVRLVKTMLALRHSPGDGSLVDAPPLSEAEIVSHSEG